MNKGEIVMGNFRDYKKETKECNFGRTDQGRLSAEEINCGAILRTADAIEFKYKYVKGRGFNLKKWITHKDTRHQYTDLKGYITSLKEYIIRLKKKKQI